MKYTSVAENLDSKSDTGCSQIKTRLRTGKKLFSFSLEINMTYIATVTYSKF